MVGIQFEFIAAEVIELKNSSRTDNIWKMQTTFELIEKSWKIQKKKSWKIKKIPI